MHGSPVVGWLLVALTGALGLGGLARLWVPCRPPGPAGPRRGAAAGDAAMGLGMAVMAVPSCAWDVGLWGARVLAGYFVVFTVACAVWAALGPDAAHRGHHVQHAVGGAAMTYLSLAMATAPGGGHTGHDGAAGVPALTGALLLYFTGYALWAGSRLLAGREAYPNGAQGSAGGEVCRGISMLTMVLTM